jgi:hypothetical protein
MRSVVDKLNEAIAAAMEEQDKATAIIREYEKKSVGLASKEAKLNGKEFELKQKEEAVNKICAVADLYVENQKVHETIKREMEVLNETRRLVHKEKVEHESKMMIERKTIEDARTANEIKAKQLAEEKAKMKENVLREAKAEIAKLGR